MKKDERIPLNSIDDVGALLILCRLAGSTKAFSDMSDIPYYKINNILQGKSPLKQEVLLSFYREMLTDEFRSVLTDAHRLTSALVELGIIKSGPGLTEMDEFETKVFDLTHEGGEASLGRDNTPKGEQTHDEPKSEPEPDPKTDLQKFGFRSRKSLDKTPSPTYSTSMLDNLIDNVGTSIPKKPEVTDPSPRTGDILESVKTGGNVHATPIGDSFETGVRLDIPDRYDSDNKRW